MMIVVRNYPPESGPVPGVWYTYPSKAAWDAAVARQLADDIAKAPPYINTWGPR
jgi:hypothetical protein